MKTWMKLNAETVSEKYLVPESIAVSEKNTFYGRFPSALLPVDSIGQLLSFLPDTENEIMNFHFTTNTSEHHEYLDDYNPLSTKGYGQYLCCDLEVANEMISIIQIEGNKLSNTKKDGTSFQKIEISESPFVEIDYPSPISREYYKFAEDSDAIINYLKLVRQGELFMTAMQVPNKSRYKNMYEENSLAYVCLNKSDTNKLCKILREIL